MFLPRLPLAVLACLAAISLAPACTRVPELDETRGASLRTAPYPALIPLGPALAADAADPDSAERLEREMAWRRARLAARAARLRAARPE